MNKDKTDDELVITRDNMRLWKLTGRNKLGIKARSKDSVEAELEFYQVKGGKTKSVRNRIIRLEKAVDIMSGGTSND